MRDREDGRLNRRLELLEAALADAEDPGRRRALRDELLHVHRQFDEADPGPRSSPVESPPAVEEPPAKVSRSGSEVRPGFYGDPFTDDGYERHFDGQRWGNSTHPAGGPTLDDLGVPEELRVRDGASVSDAGRVEVRPTRPGFYGDPFTDGGNERHFDGQRWGDSTHPAGGPTLNDLGVPEDRRFDALSPVGGTARAARKPYNRAAVAGFVLGLASILLYVIGIIPILAVVMSAIGLATFDPGGQSGRWMAVVGLLCGVIFTFMYLVAYGHIIL